MTTTPAARQLLAQIAAIQRMEKGTLSNYVPPGRSAGAGPYHKLQCWAGGKNLTRHVRPEELPAIKQALEGYAKFQELAARYADLIIQQTREHLDVDIKKKILPYSRHSKRKSTA
jgi:hypothetical protein